MEQVAAVLFGAMSLVVSAFQVALVLGAPWGEYTLGGRWRGSLPARVRILPGVSAVLLVAFAVVVAARAGLAFGALGAQSTTWIWLVVAFCGVGVLANAMTPSRLERSVWLPVVVVMLVLSVVVAVS